MKIVESLKEHHCQLQVGNQCKKPPLVLVTYTHLSSTSSVVLCQVVSDSALVGQKSVGFGIENFTCPDRITWKGIFYQA